jgi:hypothetical protein
MCQHLYNARKYNRNGELETLQDALLECWERIKPPHERRLRHGGANDGKPVEGWNPRRGKAFSFFSQVIRNAMLDSNRNRALEEGRIVKAMFAEYSTYETVATAVAKRKR